MKIHTDMSEKQIYTFNKQHNLKKTWLDSSSPTHYQNTAPSSHGGPATNKKPVPQEEKTNTQ